MVDMHVDAVQRQVIFAHCSLTFVNCGHLKKKITAPWLKNLVEYSYLLPKYSLKILREKNGRFLFISLFVKGAFYMQVYGEWHYRGRYNLNIWAL